MSNFGHPIMRQACASVVVTLVACGLGHAGTVVVSKNGPIPTILQGVNAAGPGDTVLVKSGVYQENVIVPNTRDGLKLKAKGKVIIEARPQGGTGAGPGIQVRATGVSISGFVIQNAADQASPVRYGYGIECPHPGLTVEKCVITGCQHEAVYVTSGAGTRLLDCELTGNRGGVYIGGDDVLVSKVKLLGDDLGRIEISGANARVTKCKVGSTEVGGITVTGPDAVVEKSTVSDIKGPGISISGPAAKVQKNKVYGVTGFAIHLAGSPGGLVKANVIRRAAEDALVVDNSTGAEVKDNRIEAVGGAGLVFDHSDDGLLEKNTIAQCDGRGIVASSVCNNLVILKNELDSLGGTGIQINGSNFTIRKNTITHCFDDARGLETTAALTGGLIAENEFSYCATYAVYLIDDTTGITLEDNRIMRCGNSGKHAAIRVKGSGHTIARNEIEECCGDGIVIEGDGNAIEHNEVTACTRDGIDVFSGTGNDLTGNKVTGCGAEGIENSAGNTELVGCTMKNNRLDLANDGSGKLGATCSYATGGWTTPPEID